MATAWEKSRNITMAPGGTARSLLGYAGESLVIGRALACGYNLLFKAWRDAKYDAVLDYHGTLFRVEIKQTGDGKNLSLTSGGRSGTQIVKGAAARSREVVLSTDDSDFVIGVHSLSGRCWVIPTEVVEITDRKTLRTTVLADFEEAWALFQSASTLPGPHVQKVRLGGLPIGDLKRLARQLGLNVNARSPKDHELRQSRVGEATSLRDLYALAVWRHLARAARLEDDPPV